MTDGGRKAGTESTGRRERPLSQGCRTPGRGCNIVMGTRSGTVVKDKEIARDCGDRRKE